MITESEKEPGTTSPDRREFSLSYRSGPLVGCTHEILLAPDLVGHAVYRLADR